MTGHPDGSVDPWSLRDHTEDYLAEDEVLLAARDAATQLGSTPVSPGAGAGLRFLAATINAKAVVEIGTGAGLSGLWLLRGMTPDGVLTSIDIDPEFQRVARRAFTAGGHGPSRLRLINGLGLEVLPRLTDGGYDLVFIDTDPTDHPRYLDEAVRLLRNGGIVVLNHALATGVPDPDSDAPAPVLLREAARQVRSDDRLVPMLLPLGNGLLAAVKKT
ncbi:O-methyltransferase [Pseudonocardia humida]|uniref:O-methyltransferase n=1 Tax=Pseudonocardia humida TaxID=2800819 RepID=A0ABT1A3M8_9PSEU|nr:O-methyltransferase [Pseudonocardia humida]MCO1657546.1 O-methyltransferase [Pseudonocardia humida]